MDKMNFMNRGEGEVQRSLGTARTYIVKVYLLRKDVYIVPVATHEVTASSEDEAIETTRSILLHTLSNPTAKLVYEVKVK